MFNNQICIKQETFDKLLELALNNCVSNTQSSGELKINLGEKINENYFDKQKYLYYWKRR